MRSVESFLSRCDALLCGQSPRVVLQRAYYKIELQENWTTEALARDSEGFLVRAEDPSAVCWSIDGAVAASCNKFGILPPYLIKLLDQVALDCFNIPEGIHTLNDFYNHDTALLALRRAIERAPLEKIPA